METSLETSIARGWIQGEEKAFTKTQTEVIWWGEGAFTLNCSFLVAKSRLTLCDPWTAGHQASLSFTISWSLFKLVSIELVIPSNHFILCHPLLLLPSVFSSIRVFSNESALHIRRPKYWSFSISSSNEYSELVSFRIDWFNLLAVQWTLRSLLQHHSLKSSVLWHSAFFVVQLSHPYMTTRKTIALTIQTFVGKVMSLLFKFPMKVYRSFSSKEQASLNFLAAVTVCSDFGAQENKVCHCFHFFLSYLP